MAAAALAAPTLNVLLVEDDDADVALVEEYFLDQALPGDLHRVPDGIVALQYLRRENGFRAAPRPDLILLDLNMPRMDGRELLQVIKAPDSPWKAIPVIVFTTSSAAEDIARSYDAYANAFVTKAIDYNDFQGALAKIHEFFGTVASLDRGKGEQPRA
ncbi:response regulator [Rugosimonospora acidiphila]|uniref:Response regulator n=1 Tax=Rugosimonospora acidiphila TaxID=556531 RepID=A0ABP9SMM5_9ACTN